MAAHKPILYSYFRSSCSNRVRIALNLKNIEYECRPVDLAKGESRTEAYKKINPRGLVPALVLNSTVFTESMAIIELLDEMYPDVNPLLPKNPQDRAKVRAIAAEVVSNIQPMQTLKAIEAYGGGDKGVATAGRFIEAGLDVLELELAKTSGKYSFGDQITLADLVLPGQVYNASQRFNVDMSKYPTISRINDELSKLPEFQRADAWHQPDTPGKDVK